MTTQVPPVLSHLPPRPSRRASGARSAGLFRVGTTLLSGAGGTAQPFLRYGRALAMAWASVGTLSSNAGKSANTLIQLLVGNNAAAGSVVLVLVAKDETSTGTSDGDPNECTSVTDDAGGNTYTKIAEFANMQTSAAEDGAVISVFYSKLATALVGSTHLITANFSASTTARVISAWNFSIAAGSTVSVAAAAQTNAGDAADPASQTISGLTSGEYLFVHALASEGPEADAFTMSTNYTELSATGAIGTSGGAADSNMSVVGEYRILTGTGDSVNMSSNTADRDYAQVYFALLETLAGGAATYYPSRLSLLGVG
jgi:hypothetical protein